MADDLGAHVEYHHDQQGDVHVQRFGEGRVIEETDAVFYVPPGFRLTIVRHPATGASAELHVSSGVLVKHAE